MGMPGFSGFPAELTILIGTWKTAPWWAVFAAVGVLVAAAFTLRAIQVSFFGTTDKSSSSAVAPIAGNPVHYAPITRAERAGAMLLIAATVYVGLKPDVLFQWITPALQSPLLRGVLNGGAP
jgi:NADH-quinone oxidoreductase subunit M